MHAMIILNFKWFFFAKPLNLIQMFSFDMYKVKIEKKISSTILLHLPNRSVSSTKKKIINTVLKSEVSSFIEEKQLHLLKPLFKSSKHFNIFYKFALNYDVARDIVDKILPHISKTEDIVVEANPGLGLITLCLLNSNVPKVIILDKSEITSIAVNQLVRHYQRKLKIIKVNLFKCPGLQITNLIEDSIKSNSSTKVIGIIANNTFLINLIYTYTVNELWDNIHYLEFYLVVGSIVWNTIITCTSSNSRYYYHSLFNFMFQYEDLGKYPSDAFFPVPSNDKDNLTLVKIKANSELIGSIDKNELKNYLFFLDILSKNRQTFIIPTLEKFVPNCGPYLISKGVSMSNIIRDFSPSDCVLLFNFFRKCKGYEIFKTFNYISHENIPPGVEETR